MLLFHLYAANEGAYKTLQGIDMFRLGLPWEAKSDRVWEAERKGRQSLLYTRRGSEADSG